MVYVLDHNNNPIMPTNRTYRVRQLLKNKEAVVVCRKLFTIKLTKPQTRFVQDVNLGIDCGSKHIGLSATTKQKEVFSATAELRTNVTELLSTRRELRRTRRSRLRYRPTRFNNRVHSKHKGWLAPSVENRIAFHLKLINLIRKILPITSITLEVGQFDPQLINNPEIQGSGYQQGEQMGYYNLREYVLYRDGHKCQHCKGKSGDPILNVHHIESRKTGGNSPNNLITLCETCHKAYHNGEIQLKVKRGKSLRDAAVMNIMKDELYKRAKILYGEGNVHRTWGYFTKYNRMKYGIAKDHNTDARVISGNPSARPIDKVWEIRQMRRHNRQIHKAKILKGGRLKLNQSPYVVHGFRLWDEVRYNYKLWLVKGRRLRGDFLLVSVDGSEKIDSVKYCKLGLVGIANRIIMLKKKYKNGERDSSPNLKTSGYPRVFNYGM